LTAWSPPRPGTRRPPSPYAQARPRPPIGRPPPPFGYPPVPHPRTAPLVLLVLSSSPPWPAATCTFSHRKSGSGLANNFVSVDQRVAAAARPSRPLPRRSDASTRCTPGTLFALTTLSQMGRDRDLLKKIAKTQSGSSRPDRRAGGHRGAASRHAGHSVPRLGGGHLNLSDADNAKPQCSAPPRPSTKRAQAWQKGLTIRIDPNPRRPATEELSLAMDFFDTPEERRPSATSVRSWLDVNLPKFLADWGRRRRPGRRAAPGRERGPNPGARKDWQRPTERGRWAGDQLGPISWGGREATPVQKSSTRGDGSGPRAGASTTPTDLADRADDHPLGNRRAA